MSSRPGCSLKRETLCDRPDSARLTLLLNIELLHQVRLIKLHRRLSDRLVRLRAEVSNDRSSAERPLPREVAPHIDHLLQVFRTEVECGDFAADLILHVRLPTSCGFAHLGSCGDRGQFAPLTRDNLPQPIGVFSLAIVAIGSNAGPHIRIPLLA